MILWWMLAIEIKRNSFWFRASFRPTAATLNESKPTTTNLCCSHFVIWLLCSRRVAAAAIFYNFIFSTTTQSDMIMLWMVMVGAMRYKYFIRIYRVSLSKPDQSTNKNKTPESSSKKWLEDNIWEFFTNAPESVSIANAISRKSHVPVVSCLVRWIFIDIKITCVQCYPNQHKQCFWVAWRRRKSFHRVRVFDRRLFILRFRILSWNNSREIESYRRRDTTYCRYRIMPIVECEQYCKIIGQIWWK